MSRGHLALAAERGELVPLPEFLERAWQIMRDEPEVFDGEADLGRRCSCSRVGDSRGSCDAPARSCTLVPALRS